MTDADRRTLLGLFEDEGSQNVTIEQRPRAWRVTFEVYPDTPSHAGPAVGDWATTLEEACLSAAERL